MKKIEDIMSMLPPSVLILDSISPEYIQHIPSVVEKAQFEFIELCKDRGILPKDMDSNNVSRQGIVGRYLDDSGSSLYKNWYRFMCIDSLYREWSQPYYAHNELKYNETNSTCINKKYPELISYFRDIKIDSIL